MSDSLSNKLDQMNEFLTTQDLVDLGIYVSLDAAYLSRVRENSPRYIKLARKILYPKIEVIRFLEDRLHKSPSTSHTNTSGTKEN